MTTNQPSYELTDDQRAAAERLANSNNPASSLATILLELDDAAKSDQKSTPK